MHVVQSKDFDYKQKTLLTGMEMKMAVQYLDAFLREDEFCTSEKCFNSIGTSDVEVYARALHIVKTFVTHTLLLAWRQIQKGLCWIWL